MKYFTNIKQKKNIMTGLLITASFVIMSLFYCVFPSFFALLDSRCSDGLFKLRYTLKGHEPVSPYMSILAITDEFIENEAIPDRRLFSKLINRLAELRAGVIASDTFWSGLLSGFSTTALDTELADATSRAGNVFYPVYLKKQKNPRMIFPDHDPANIIQDIFSWSTDKHIPGQIPVMGRVYLPIEPVFRSARGAGHINLSPDGDGVNRSVYLFFNYKDRYVPSYGLAVVCEFLEVDPRTIKVHPGKYVILKNAFFPGGRRTDIRIPIDAKGRMIINYPGPWENSFRFINPVWITEQENKIYQKYTKPLVRNAIVLITDVSTWAKDYVGSVFEPVYPAAGVLATIINSVLKDDFLSSQSPGEILLICFILAVGIWLVVINIKPKLLLPVGLLAILLFSGWGIFCFMILRKVPVIILPLAGLIIAFISSIIYTSFLEDKKIALGIIDKLEQKVLSCDSNNVTVGSGHNSENIHVFDQRCIEFGITQRQKEIIRLTFDSFESKEIAYKLDISTRTVDNHLAQIYEKTNTRNKLALVRLMFYNA